MKLFYKEKQGNKRIIHIGKIKISYKCNLKKVYQQKCIECEELRQNYEYLKRHSDITKLRPANGELRLFQIALLEYCNSLIKIIEEQHFQYFLIAGTLLGAVRHNGFIPWDDDFDIGMMRTDFENFNQFCKENFVNIDNSMLNINDTNFIQKNYDLIDFYLKKYPNQILYYRYWEHLQLFSGSSLKDLKNLDIFPFDYYKDDYDINYHNSYLKELRKKIQEIGNISKIIQYLDNERKTNNNIVINSNTILYGIDNTFSYTKEIKKFFNKKTFLPYTKVPFENYKYFVPNDYSSYLNQEFGNYMCFPNDIGYSHHLDIRKQYTTNEEKKSVDVISDKNSLIEFYLIDAFEIYHFLPIYNELLNQGINVRIVAEPCEINSDGGWFDYNTAVKILKELNIDYSTKCNPNAAIAITTQRVEILNKYKNLKINFSYGVGFSKNYFNNSRESTDGFDIKFVHGDYQKNLIEKYNLSTQIIKFGYPKFDSFFNNTPDRNNLLKKLGINTEKKIITYFPTWDEDSSISKFALSIKELKKNFYIIVKPHHCTFRIPEKKTDLETLYQISDFVLDGNYNFAEAALLGDIALCDIKSGASCDVPYINKNIAVILLSSCYNLDRYSNIASEYFDIVINPSELVQEINKILINGFDKNKREKFLKEVYDNTDIKHTTEILINLTDKKNINEKIMRYDKWKK